MHYGDEEINQMMAHRDRAPEYHEQAIALIKDVLGCIPSPQQYPPEAFATAELMVRYALENRDEGAPVLEKDIRDMIESIFEGCKYVH